MAASVFSQAGVVQRRRSVGHYLTLLAADPEVVASEPAYREMLWAPPAPRSDGHALVAGQWSALIAKDVWQEAICSVWSEFCRSGLARTRDLGRGLTWEETRDSGRRHDRRTANTRREGADCCARRTPGGRNAHH